MLPFELVNFTFALINLTFHSFVTIKVTVKSMVRITVKGTFGCMVSITVKGIVKGVVRITVRGTLK